MFARRIVALAAFAVTSFAVSSKIVSYAGDRVPPDPQRFPVGFLANAFPCGQDGAPTPDGGAAPEGAPVFDLRIGVAAEEPVLVELKWTSKVRGTAPVDGAKESTQESSGDVRFVDEYQLVDPEAEHYDARRTYLRRVHTEVLPLTGNRWLLYKILSPPDRLSTPMKDYQTARSTLKKL